MKFSHFGKIPHSFSKNLTRLGNFLTTQGAIFAAAFPKSFCGKFTFPNSIAPLLYFKKYGWTAAYISVVVLINWLFLALPMVDIWGIKFPPVMLVVGFVFVFRDFAQREVGHGVILAMLVAGLLSYLTSAPFVALASLTAFLISEFIDWAVYTFTKRPLSERILYSSIIAVPIDTFVFLKMVNHFDWVAMAIVTAAKMVGGHYVSG